MAATAEPLTRADAAWLHAEAPTNPFVITSLALLDGPVDPERFLAMLSKRLDQHPRLRQVVRDPLRPAGAPEWIAAPDFDLRAHVHHDGLPAPGGHAELVEYVSDLAGRPIDFHRPFWEVHLIDGPEQGGAIVSRLHHSLGDGQAMVKMLLSLTDRTPGGWRRRPPQTAVRRRPPSLLGAATSLAALAGRAPQLAQEGLRLGLTVARLTLMDPDPETVLRGRLTMVKRVAWSRPVPLRQVKRVAHRYGATVNDVIVSAVAGSIGAYLRQAGYDTGGLTLRAMVPVNLRPPDDTGMTQNRFSLVYLDLPVGVTDPAERLLRVSREMNRIKHSAEAQAGWVLLLGLGLVPSWLEHAVAGFYADKASLVLTNVMGPRHPLYICGRRMEQMTFWEPESGGLGVGVSVYSYAGQVIVGAISDSNLVADPARISTGFEESFEELMSSRGGSWFGAAP